MNETPSPKFSINGQDVWKTLRGGLIILASVVITAVLGYVATAYETWNYIVCAAELPCIDLRFLAVPVISSILELGRRWLSGWSR